MATPSPLKVTRVCDHYKMSFYCGAHQNDQSLQCRLGADNICLQKSRTLMGRIALFFILNALYYKMSFYCRGIWGASSADSNEMWVSLIEKAFARQVSLKNPKGGQGGGAVWQKFLFFFPHQKGTCFFSQPVGISLFSMSFFSSEVVVLPYHFFFGVATTSFFCRFCPTHPHNYCTSWCILIPFSLSLSLNLWLSNDFLLLHFLFYSRFHGSYGDVWGGSVSDAFVKMTGGIAEWFKTKDLQQRVLFDRCKNGLSTGSVIGCSVNVSVGYWRSPTLKIINIWSKLVKIFQIGAVYGPMGTKLAGREGL